MRIKTVNDKSKSKNLEMKIKKMEILKNRESEIK